MKHLFCNEFGPRDRIANEFQNSAHQLTLQACTQLPHSNSSFRSEQHFVNLTEIYYSVLVLRGVI